MTDDDLLARLGAALSPPAPSEPPAASVAALMGALDAAVRPAPSRHRFRRWSSRLAACAATLAVLGGGTGAAFAAGAPVPAAVRDAAHDLGLPVASSAKIDADRATQALSRALRQGHPAAVSARAEALRRALAHLDGNEHRQAARSAAEELADAVLVAGPPTSSDATPATGAVPSAHAQTPGADGRAGTAPSPHPGGSRPGPTPDPMAPGAPSPAKAQPATDTTSTTVQGHRTTHR